MLGRSIWPIVAGLALGMLVAGPARADLPRGASAEDWLRRGGAVLELQIVPANATVDLDGDRIHPGPILVTPGVHLLVVRASGRRELRQELRIPSGEVTRRRVELTTQPVTGRVEVSTVPRHASVLVDGRLANDSPCVLVLTAGRHRLQVVAPGYRDARRLVRVPRGATLRLRVELVPDRRHHHRPRVATARARTALD